MSEAAPELVDVEGVGTDTAASLLIATEDNSDRAQRRGCLCTPVRGRADTGLFGQDRPPPPEPTWQSRRQPGPVRDCCLPHERTRTYAAKRTAEGKSKKEIIRCLKRYIAREIYRILSSLYFLRETPISVP